MLPRSVGIIDIWWVVRILPRMPDLLREFALEQIEGVQRPILRPGDIVVVETQVTEGDKTRLQKFEGTVIALRGSGPSATLTVRREIGKFAVERIFPLYSPLIKNIDITKRQKVRRSKLNYLRQAGRRRVKEDELAMQRHVQEEQDKQRLAEEAKKRAEEKAAKEEAEKAKAEKAEKEPEANTEEKPTEEKK